MTTPSQFATQLASLLAQYNTGAITQSQYATQLANAISDYDSVGTLADRLQQVIDLNSSIINSIRMFAPTGTVPLVSNLPTVADPGEFWVVTTGTYAGHGYLRVNALWVDMGVIQGPIGQTPQIEVKQVNAVSPSTAPTVVVTGTPERPQLTMNLPRGRNARNSVSISATYGLEPLEILGFWVAEQDTTFSPALSRARAKVAPANAYTITILKNGTAWGTISWAANSTTATVTIAAPSVSAGDLLEFVAAATPDPNLAHVAVTLAGAD